MDTVLRNGKGKTLNPTTDISGAIRIVKTMQNPPQLEFKRTAAGEMCGFCAEWKPGGGPREEAIREAMAKISGLGMQVFGNSRSPTFDVIPGSTNKGVAVEVLREMLHVPEGLMYIGDSDTDNPAFRASDVSIGILGKGAKSDLKCDYYLKQRALNRFLLSLLDDGFEFTEKLPGLFRGGVQA
jgi:hydroxymethylpyrimidine pyrophosphatase-like HAD family hydrolase